MEFFSISEKTRKLRKNLKKMTILLQNEEFLKDFVEKPMKFARKGQDFIEKTWKF